MVRLLQRNITQSDALEALLNGEIIEEYENDYPYPSCLVYGINLNNEVAKQLEKLVNAVRNSITEITVINYTEKVA